MTYTEATSWHTAPAGTVALWTAALAHHGADQPSRIASAYFDRALAVGLNPDLALAQACHETGWFTSDRWIRQGNPAGIGITSSTVAGPTFSTVSAGIEAHLAHICCYVYTLADCPIERNGWHDPRHSFHDGIEAFSTLERPERRWAYPGDGYLAAILAIANAVAPGGDEGEATVSVPKPTMTILNSPNRDGYGGTRRVEALVLHITAGTDSRGWLTSPQSKASANYLIERDGTIYQLVPPDHDAWANGVVNQPDVAGGTGNPLIAGWLTERDSQGQPINLNQRTISIEHEGMTSNFQGGSLTPAQVHATVALQAWLCATYQIPPDREHIIGHNQIDDVDRHYCPGFSGQEWHDWIEKIAALVNLPASAKVNTNPGFPGAIGSRGNLIVNGVDFGGSDIVTVEVAAFQVLNSKGERYHIQWRAYQVEGWQAGLLLPPAPAPPPAPDPAPSLAPAPAPTPQPAPTPGGTMQLHDHGDIPLTQPERAGGQVVDPASGHLAEVFMDTQKDFALAIWWQPKGWLPTIKYQSIIPGRWLLSVALVIHEEHLKVRLVHCPPDQTADLRDQWLDLGAVTAL